VDQSQKETNIYWKKRRKGSKDPRKRKKFYTNFC